MSAKSYEIRVAGVVPPDELLEFENLRTVVQPARTVIRAKANDQVALRALLQRLQGLGIDLTDVRRVASDVAAVPPADR